MRSVANHAIDLGNVKRAQSRYIVVSRDGAEEAVASANDVVESQPRRDAGQWRGVFVKQRRGKTQLVGMTGLEPRPDAQRQRRRKAGPAYDELASVGILARLTADI